LFSEGVGEGGEGVLVEELLEEDEPVVEEAVVCELFWPLVVVVLVGVVEVPGVGLMVVLLGGTLEVVGGAFVVVLALVIGGGASVVVGGGITVVVGG
jgi:hypothetical protein